MRCFNEYLKYITIKSTRKKKIKTKTKVYKYVDKGNSSITQSWQPLLFGTVTWKPPENAQVIEPNAKDKRLNILKKLYKLKS